MLQMNAMVSVVIPTHNRKKEVLDCLKSITNSSYTNYEIIAIDDASDDGTIDAIRSCFPLVRVFRNRQQKGAAYCKNQGILESKGEFIWFLDSDSVIMDNGCMGRMVQLLQENNRIGCIGGELVEEGGRYFVRIDYKDISVKLPYEEHDKHRFTLVKVRSVMACNLCVRRELMARAGGFDTIYSYISEDTDICEKIHALGYEVILDWRTLVLHHYSKTHRKSNYYLLFRNEIRCSIKNYGLIRGLINEPVRLFRNILLSSKNKIKNRTNLFESIHIVSTGKHRGKIFPMLFLLVADIIRSFLFAYLWNILFAYKTTTKDRKVNFLALTVAANP